MKHPETVALLRKLGAPALIQVDDEEILGVIKRKIEVPEEALETKQWLCTVRSNHNVATYIKELVLELPEGEAFNFKAGGYIQIECAPHCVAYKDFDIDSLTVLTKSKVTQDFLENRESMREIYQRNSQYYGSCCYIAILEGDSILNVIQLLKNFGPHKSAERVQ